MIITNRIKVSVLVVLTLVFGISLSSFVKTGPVLKAKKINGTEIKAPAIVVTYYWTGTGWSGTPIAECGGNGEICSVTFNLSSGKTPDQGRAAYLASGYLSDPSITSANVYVGTTLFYVVERAGGDQ